MTKKTITSAKTVENITVTTQHCVITPPPPPRQKYNISPKGFLSVKSFLHSLSLILLFFLLSGCPENMTTYVDVPIYITNTDTNAPMVTNHRFAVAENVNIGTVIGNVKSSDNIAVTYYVITTGDSNYIFSINTNGDLRNVMNLDHDTTSSYSLTVHVSDAAGNISNATIMVTVIDVDAAPTVTTIGASNIENNSVTLNGSLSDLGTNSDGSEQVNEYGFIYSTNTSGSDSLQLGKTGVEKIARTIRTTNGNYSFAITGLPPGTIHYFRAFAVNDGGNSYGHVSNFYTTYHRTFALSGATNKAQSNLIHPYSTHTYSVFLSNTHSYDLTVEANSNVSDNVNIYQGTSTEPLLIRTGSFSIQTTGSTIAGVGNATTTFSGVSNGSRHLVLPLLTTNHRLVLSNNSAGTESYSLTLAEETGTAGQPVGRLLVDETPMGYFSNNEPEFYWVHIPNNRSIRGFFSGVVSGNNCALSVDTTVNLDPRDSTILVELSNNPDNSSNRYEILRIINNNGTFDYRGCQFRFRLQ